MEPLLIALLGGLALAGLLWSTAQLWLQRRHQRVLQARWQQVMPEPLAALQVELSLRGRRSWSRWPALDRALPRVPWLQGLARWLESAAWPWLAGDTLAVTAVLALAAAAFGWGLAGVFVAGLVGGLAVPALLWALVSRRRATRMTRIDAQLPDALDIMARSMQAGHAFSSALQIAAAETPMPLAQELQRVFDEVHFGHPLQQTLPALAQRVDSEEMQFFVTSVLIQRETGGDLAALLLGTASLIRERQELAGQVRVLSAEGRLSAWVLSLLPIALGGVMLLLNPAFMAPLWQSQAGQRLVGVSALLWLLGVLWMARLVRIRV